MRKSEIGCSRPEYCYALELCSDAGDGDGHGDSDDAGAEGGTGEDDGHVDGNGSMYRDVHVK